MVDFCCTARAAAFALAGMAACAPRGSESMQLADLAGAPAVRKYGTGAQPQIYAFDGNVATAFCAAPGKGNADFLTFRFHNTIRAEGIRVVNGSMRSRTAPQENASIERLQISSGRHSGSGTEGMGPAEIVLQAPALAAGKPEAGLYRFESPLVGSEVHIAVLSQRGQSNLPLCLSEIEFGVWRGEEFHPLPLGNPEVVTQRIEALRAADQHVLLFHRMQAYGDRFIFTSYERPAKDQWLLHLQPTGEVNVMRSSDDDSLDTEWMRGTYALDSIDPDGMRFTLWLNNGESGNRIKRRIRFARVNPDSAEARAQFARLNAHEEDPRLRTGQLIYIEWTGGAPDEPLNDSEYAGALRYYNAWIPVERTEVFP